jgi:hypothetical protein
VYPVGVKLIWPVAGRGRPRKRHIPDILSRAAEDMLAKAKWQNVSWRNGTKGRLEARFAAVRPIHHRIERQFQNTRRHQQSCIALQQ